MMLRSIRIPDAGNDTSHGGLAQSADIVVVGSGAAGLTAACVAASRGAAVVVLEQASRIGGTTAISGGMVWIPGNPKLGDGADVDRQAAREYLAVSAPEADAAEIESFLRWGPQAIDYMETHTRLRLRPVPTYPDYYPTLPGATLRGRVLEPVPYDGTALGRWFGVLRDPLPEYTLFGGMMISRQDIPHLRRMGKSLPALCHVIGLLARHGRQRVRHHRGTSLYLGNALAGYLLESALDLGVTIVLRSPVESLVWKNGRVQGVQLADGGSPGFIQARNAVILATGGISGDAVLRRHYVPGMAGDLTATAGSGAATTGAKLAAAIGAALSEATENGAFWVPVSRFKRRNGERGVFPHTVSDRAKPGLIAVNGEGRRFVNEALSYHEFVKGQLRDGLRAIPAYLIVDQAFLWKYGLGCVKPFTLSLRHYLKSGYLATGRTPAELASIIGVPPSTLAATIARFNDGAARGEDPDFQRGSDAYQRHLGDADQTPNPCVAPLRGRLYSVAVEPADLGMAAGLRTDLDGRVMANGGGIIEGLYACGNDRQSIMRGAYPGPGITLGPAITFAYRTAWHATGK